MGSGNILWKFELDQIIFLDFTGIESLKYKDIRVSGAKLFLSSIYCTYSAQNIDQAKKNVCLLSHAEKN